MFGGDDPFGFNMFGHVHRQMREMDQMMNAMMDPFGMTRQMPVHPMLQNRLHQRANDEEMGVAMPMMHPFGNFGGIFGNMQNMQQRAMNDPDSHVFVQSTTITFDPHGRQRVVTNSTRKAGDVREDRRRIRDHDTDEMEIGHAIGNRKHYIEKKRDKDGIVRSQQRFVNMDEADAADFDKEFHSRARGNFDGSHLGHAALTDGSVGSNRHTGRSRRSPQSVHEPNAPIVTLPEEEEAPHPSRESTRTHTGPIIREISDEEADSSIPKRRRGFF